jgi:hypothetical protein
MRWLPAPLSVTSPPPSITISGPVSLTIFAVSSSVITTGSGPQSNVMMPPSATAATNAAPVQLAGVPVPTTVRGALTSMGRPSSGTEHVPSGLPAGGPDAGFVSGFGNVPDPPPHAKTVTGKRAAKPHTDHGRAG